MKIGSLFDGSGGFPLAATMCGIEPVWAAEIEPFPIAVTRSRFPNMKHLGSVTDIKGNEVEPVDVITFGSPCQDLSVAGKRAGLKHTENGDDETTRSGLFIEAIRIIKEMREATNGVYPRFAVWENAPGAFSSNKGEDFRIVLEEFIKVVEPTATMPSVPKNGWAYADVYCGDGWSLAYRVLDAQYWGVPQRRRRIYLVADFGGRCAGKISFEREGLRGYFAKSGAQREAVAGDAENGIGTADCAGNCLTPWDSQSKRSYAIDGVFPTLSARENSGQNQQTVCYSFDSLASNSMKSSNPYSGCRQVEVSKCLDTTTPDPSKNQGGVAVVEAVGGDLYNFAVSGDKAVTLNANSGQSVNHADPTVAVPYTLKIRTGVAVDSAGKAAGKGALIQENLSATLAVAQDQYLFQPVAFAQNQRDEVRDLGDKAGALQAEPGMKQQTFLAQPVPLEPGVASREGGHIYEGVSGTLRTNTGDNQMATAYSIENHPADSRVNIDDSGKVQTLTSRMGTGGGNVPMVMEPVAYNGENITSPLNKTNPHPGDPCHTLGTDSRNYLVYCLQGNGIDRADTAGCNGKGVREDVCYTLNTIDRPAVAYTETYQTVTGPLMANSHPGSYCGQDAYNDMFVVGKENTAGVDCRNFVEHEELYPTLQSKPNGGQSLNFSGAVRVRYIVRRLTPTECARLQGFPDDWAHPDVKSVLTDEEYTFWLNVRNTHATINGKVTKEYTREQMLTWYNKLHTDSAEYKLWGNGIALPCALYMMQGIAEALCCVKGGIQNV